MAYLTIENVDAPDVADDPGYATPSLDEEMIRRASHVGTSYNIDNKALWGIIRQITHGGPGWNWVNTHNRTMNGRQAYLDFRSHYMAG
jgi:hypothetical protein